jgi:small neutral amino acid transporter SnatA (MarC family)
MKFEKIKAFMADKWENVKNGAKKAVPVVAALLVMTAVASAQTAPDMTFLDDVSDLFQAYGAKIITILVGLVGVCLGIYFVPVGIRFIKKMFGATAR